MHHPGSVRACTVALLATLTISTAAMAQTEDSALETDEPAGTADPIVVYTPIIETTGEDSFVEHALLLRLDGSTGDVVSSQVFDTNACALEASVSPGGPAVWIIDAGDFGLGSGGVPPGLKRCFVYVAGPDVDPVTYDLSKKLQGGETVRQVAVTDDALWLIASPVFDDDAGRLLRVDAGDGSVSVISKKATGVAELDGLVYFVDTKKKQARPAVLDPATGKTRFLKVAGLTGKKAPKELDVAAGSDAVVFYQRGKKGYAYDPASKKTTAYGIAQAAPGGSVDVLSNGELVTSRELAQQTVEYMSLTGDAGPTALGSGTGRPQAPVVAVTPEAIWLREDTGELEMLPNGFGLVATQLVKYDADSLEPQLTVPLPILLEDVPAAEA